MLVHTSACTKPWFDHARVCFSSPPSNILCIYLALCNRMSGRRSTESNVFERWCQEELSRLLKFQVGEDLVQYLFTIETAKDVEEYLKELLGSEVCGS